MPRLPRIYIQGSLYYVTCNSLPNQKIFREKEDYQMYFGLLKKYKEELGVRIYAYTLLPNHLHLLCEVKEETSISTLMHNLSSNYTKYYNARYERRGHLFRERFKAAFIEKNPSLLLNLTAHIHLNAQRLNLTILGETYPYSSYSLYLDYNQGNNPGLDIKEEISEILSALVGENYNSFVARISEDEEFKKLHKQLQRKKILGSGEFTERVKQEILLQQEENQMQNQAEDNNLLAQNRVLIKTPTAILIFVLTLAGIYVYFNFSRNAAETQNNIQQNMITTLESLEQTEWQAQIFAADGTVVSNDVMSFKNKKFNSAYVAQFAYPHTNYSMAQENNKIIWETIQTSPLGTASWRGEVVNGQMNGVMSLRKEGKPAQDFYFKSIKYWKRESSE
ncbi:MAG: transposase [Candidatus Omnitrophota bacterium]